MKKVCEGRSLRDLKAYYYKCPKCGYEVEIFSDEVKRRCPSCKTWVFAQEAASCLEWCPAAEKCKALLADYRDK